MFFPYKCIGKQTWPCRKKGQMSMYDHYFSNFGRPPIPDDLSKDSAPKHPRFWRRRFLKVFTIYGLGSHLDQRTATILANFHFLNLRRLHMKFEQNWPRSSRGEVVWNSEHFSHPNAFIRKQNWPYCKKVKCQYTTFILAILARPPVPDDLSKDSAPRHSLVLEKKIFQGFLPI